MSVCPFCGNELEEYDFICGKCGRTIEAQDSKKESYGGTANNNTYTRQSSGNEDYSIYPSYNPANDRSAYPTYNNSGVGTNPTVKDKKKTALLIGIGIALFVLVMAIIFRPIIWEYRTKEYRYVIQAYMEASIKGDYAACYNYLYVDVYKELNKVISDSTVVSSLIEDASWAVRNQRNMAFNSINFDYNNLKTKIEIKSISNLSGSKKAEAIERAKSEWETKLTSKYVDVDNYFKENEIEKVVRIEAKVKFYLGKKNLGTRVVKYDLVKIKGESGWKILYNTIEG